jgi:hypothetical protein
MCRQADIHSRQPFNLIKKIKMNAPTQDSLSDTEAMKKWNEPSAGNLLIQLSFC